MQMLLPRRLRRLSSLTQRRFSVRQSQTQAYNMDAQALGEGLDIDPAIWKKIVKGEFYPSKNLVLAMGIFAHLSYRDVKELLMMSGYAFDFTNVLDVVISYLLVKGIYNTAMVDAALEEYHILPMMVKR